MRFLVISLLILSGVFFLTSCKDKSAGGTVKYHGKNSTPSERIAEINQLHKDYTPEDDEEQKVKISGTVTTVDGNQAGKWNLNVYGYRGNIGIGSNYRRSENDTFSSKVPPGESIIGGFMEGYAPYVKILDLKAGQELTDLKVVFDHGFQAKVQLVDQQGRPVDNAIVKTGLQFRNITTGEGLQGISGADGIAILEKAIEHPMSISIVADGFQKIERRDFKPTKGQVHKYVMKKALPASGIVVSAETGKPIPDAQLRICTKRSPDHQYGYGFSDKIAAETDSDGKFLLDTLEDDASYDIIVSCDGYGFQYVPAVKAGNNDIKILLGKPVKLKGKIVGDLSKLGTQKKKIEGVWNSYYKISASCRMDSMNASRWQEAAVKEINGAGYFEFDNVFGDLVELSSGNLNNLQTLQLIKDKSEYDILIDLDAKIEMPGRDVVIKFIPPKGMPAPQGAVYVTWVTENPRTHHNKTVKIKDGIAKLKVDVPCEVLCNIRRWNETKMKGYWFDRVSDIKVDDEEYEFELEIPVKQAGAIFGRILKADGTLGYGYNTVIHVIDKPKDTNTGFVNESMDNNASVSTGKYYASPIPLGGKYIISARKGNYIMTGKTIKLTSSKSIAENDLHRGDSIDIKGRILNADGEPMANTSYSISAETDVSGQKYTWGGRPQKTDQKGQFVIKGVNPDSDTDYYVRVPSQNDRLKIRSIKKFNTLKLSRTKVVKGSVINKDTGKGIAGIAVSIYVKVDPENSYHAGQVSTDNNGIFEVTVPENNDVNAYIQFSSIRDQYSGYDERPGHLTFLLTPVNRLTGKLIDADTGKGIAGVKINGYAFAPSHKSYRSELCPTTDADGNFIVNNVTLESYGVTKIQGYQLVDKTEITFAEGERKKEFIIKVRKTSE